MTSDERRVFGLARVFGGQHILIKGVKVREYTAAGMLMAVIRDERGNEWTVLARSVGEIMDAAGWRSIVRNAFAMARAGSFWHALAIGMIVMLVLNIVGLAAWVIFR